MNAITFATHKQGFIDQLMESYIRHDIAHTVLGEGKTWQGFTWKFNLMLSHLRTLPIKTIILLHDAFDVVFLASTEEIVHKYHKLCQDNDCRIVISAEEPFHGLYGLLFNCSFNRCASYPDKVVNCGMIIADCKSMIELLEYSKFYVDDQTMTTDVYFKNLLPMFLDVEYSLFLNIHKKNCWDVGGAPDVSDFSIDTVRGRIQMKNGSWPCVIQGPECTDISKILNKLGYPSASPIPYSTRLRFLRYQLGAFAKRKYVRLLLLYFLIVLLAIISVIRVVLLSKKNRNRPT